MFNHPEARLGKLRRVILTTELARVEQDSQNLGVCPCRPLRQKEKAAEEQYAAEQTAEKVESRRAHDERNEKQLSFRAQNRQRFVDRLVSGVDTAFCWHCYLLRSRKEPGQKVHRCDCHSNAEDNPGKHPLVSAFTEGKHQTANHDCDKAQTLGNRASEGRLKLLDSVFPGTVAGLQKDQRE